VAALLAMPAVAAATDVTRTLGPGAWSWFGEPRALDYGNRVYAGWVDPTGRVTVGSFDDRSGSRIDLARMSKVDDHDSPSLQLRPDGRLTVFYSHHADSFIHFRTTLRPRDIGEWGAPQTVRTARWGKWGNTYPSPVWLPRENRLWLFWRGSDWSPAFSRASWDGRWSRPRRLMRAPGQRPYVKYVSNGRDAIHMAFTQGHPREARTGIYYAVYRRGAFYRANGRRLARMRDLPFRPSRADKVHDGRRGRRAWVHDIALDRSGRPVIVYATLHSRRRHYYRYARWTGKRWRTWPIVAAGGSISGGRERFYSGGVALHPGDPSRVYLSRATGGVHRLEEWRTPNRGRSWSWVTTLPGSGGGNYRPVVPRGTFATSGQVLWMGGRYGSYRRFGTSIFGRFTATLRPEYVLP